MDDDSVVQLENEVIEFLRRWSSTSSEVVRLQRVDSGEDSLGRTDELSSETPVMGGSPDSIESFMAVLVMRVVCIGEAVNNDVQEAAQTLIVQGDHKFALDRRRYRDGVRMQLR